ncbi:hypothetical protein [Rhizobium nepotum]|uniref:hypothetical protein n=1 Tax=Rhizobium nepotum TaxID=1035271 RepID=UPI003CE7B25A
MNFPTADMQAAFGDFLTVEAIRRHLERQRPELLAHMQHIEGRPLIGLRLPNGQQVVCARTQIGVMAGWACVTPACSDDDIRATMGLSGSDLGQLMIEHYDALAPSRKQSAA